jgi:hypothetical protein
MSEPKVLVIDRTIWLRGEGGSKSYLLREGDGKMCCLGFDAIEYGFTEEEIEGFGEPCELEHLPRDYRNSRCGGAGVTEAININDDPELSDAEREAQLIPLLKMIGGYDDVQFIN